MTHREITDAFQAELGRTPTTAELQYFTKMGRGYGGVGQMSPYEAQQAIGATPEAQMRGLGRYGDIYAQQLAQGDSAMLGKAQGQLMGQFRQMGRPSSSGYVSAFAQAAQNLAMNRQNQMAQFYGQGAVGALNNQVGAGQGALERSYGLQENQRQFERDKTLANLNYARQQDFYKTQQRQGLQAGLINTGAMLAGGYLLGPLGAAGASYLSNKMTSEYGQYPKGMGPSFNNPSYGRG